MGIKQRLAFPVDEARRLARAHPDWAALLRWMEEVGNALTQSGATTDALYDAANVAGSFAAPTGTLDRTTFDPSTVTLEELAQRVAAHLVDHKELEG